MRKLFSLFTLSMVLFFVQSANAYSGLWQQTDNNNVPTKGVQVLHPKQYLVYSLNTSYLKQILFSLSANPNEGQIIEFPLPDGSFRDFKVWQTPMMPTELADRYPNIKTFTAEALNNHTITAKIDFTEYGLHVMIFDGVNTSFIDPFTHEDQNYYMVHYKRDEYRPFSAHMKCLVSSAAQNELQQGQPMSIEQTQLPKLELRRANGYNLRNYRIALSADNFYCQAATGNTAPTIAQSLSCMTTSMNRINGVYEREFSITMTFVAKEDTLIWTQATGTINGSDPFNSIDANAPACMSTNQSTCDTRIGSANYDMGHVFTTGGGGQSLAPCVCQSGQKAQSVTGSSTPVGDGFDIDYVAHEMGHEFGADHTFNNNVDNECAANAVQAYAYEPGSGSTIMAYASICSPDDLQYHSDAYFHAASLLQISSYTVSGFGNTCAGTKPSTNNKPVGLPAFTATYSIPYKTPFELLAPTAVDSVADTLTTYCWEQWNLGDFGAELINTYFSGPIFRSFNPTTTPLRVFPTMRMVLADSLSNAGIEGNEGEKAADTARYLTFKLTARDIYQGNGCFLIPDDSIHLNVINTGAGFTVTSPGVGTNWTGGDTKSITWNKVSTDINPINCVSVDIYLSGDRGYTWPLLIGNFPNNGSANITVPNVATNSNIRIKVKGHNNVFFNVNGSNFKITNNPSLPTVPLGLTQINSVYNNDVIVYPQPANNILNIISVDDNAFQAVILNSVGQTIWSGQMKKSLSISVNEWPKGIYFLQLANTESRRRIVKTIVVE